MNAKISDIASRFAILEEELKQEFERGIKEKELQFQYRIEKGKIAFQQEAKRIHKRIRMGILTFLWESSLASLLVAPLIYSLFVPLLILDIWLSIYQTVCFPVYGVSKVKREKYVVLDRGALGYLNWIERLNCNFCGYANGLMGYAREIASQTEQYFCPIKHASRILGAHSRYHNFLEFGDAKGYLKEFEKFRDNLRM
jgi:hypothetical protein